MSKQKAKAPRVFVPLTKVDEEQRLVYGTITQEVLDQSGEMMDYALSKPNFEKWSNDIHAASGGLSKGNLRVMHGLNVAGKITELDFNDEDQSIEVCAKVVDDAEWEKVKEGCYTGFSVGGRYGKRWNEVVDGNNIKKFEAIPNETSLVDNPCVKTATFSLIKADGVEEDVEFQLPEDVLEKLKKTAGGDHADHGDEDVEEPSTEEPTEENPAEAAVEKVAPTEYIPSNPEVAKKATELCKAAGKGDWLDYTAQAAEELIKEHLAKAAPADDNEGKSEKGKGKGDKNKKADKPAANADEEDTTVEKANHAIANRLSQKWTCTDGTQFDKKADAEAHEAKLIKTMTEAEKLAERLKKALSGEPEEVEGEPLEDMLDRFGKVFQVLETPWENGGPKLEKGMYTVSRFANVLWDLGSLCRKIAKEGVVEGGADGDPADKEVAGEMKKALATLGDSLKTYLDNQLTELLSGIDDDVCVEVYDYYYAAAQENGEDQLAKDVCAAIETHREPSRERRDELIKGFGIVSEEESSEEETLSPPLQKRFDEQADQIEKLTKVASDAIGAVETLTKRVIELGDQPMPRAPGHVVATKEGDTFFGKTATTKDEKLAVLGDLLEEHGPDGLATLMIKASQATGGVKMGLRGA